jgi:hypothetical protein
VSTILPPLYMRRMRLQCAVCDDRFSHLAAYEKHYRDVHLEEAV